MNFLGLGPGELALIAVLGLIVFGPGKLPEIAGQIGRTVRDFRRSTADITAEFQRSLSMDEQPPQETAPPIASAPPALIEPATVPSIAPMSSGDWQWERSDQDQQELASGSAGFWDWAHPHELLFEGPTRGEFWKWDEPPAPPVEGLAGQPVIETNGSEPVAEAAEEPDLPTPVQVV